MNLLTLRRKSSRWQRQKTTVQPGSQCCRVWLAKTPSKARVHHVKQRIICFPNPMPSLTEKELLQFLKTIEEGTISLRPESDPQDIYAGNVTYTATNDWRITISNDCNEWDYVDKAISADGRSVGFDSLEN